MIAKGLDPQTLAATGPLSETVQHLMAQPLYLMVRFGQWDQILQEPQPHESYGLINAMWHYARGMAHTNKGNLRAARQELAAVEKAAGSAAMKDKFVGYAPAPAVLTIAAEVLGAEVASASGKREEAIAHLDRAVRIQDGFRYNEPPDWYFPARHYLGAALLEAGRAPEAEIVYWQDLKYSPANGYALFGLQKALEAQGKTAEAAQVAEQLRVAWKDADVKLSSSRF
jgi:tetratricopeptide (TPR) repeat protein